MNLNILSTMNMKVDKLFEISGGKLIAADVSTESAVISKINDARDVVVTPS